MTTENHVDPDTITMLRDVMEDGFEPLMQSYVDDSQHRIIELHTALESQDGEQVRRLAHSLKGSSGNVGALHVAELCLKLEEQGKDGVLNEAAELLSQVEQEFTHVSAIMLGYIQ